MMERLSDGLERRGGRPMTPPPVAVLTEALTRQRDSRPELKDALEELNRLAADDDELAMRCGQRRQRAERRPE